MTKRTIWLLISLMAIALIGISSFQVYWINNVIKLSKERFDKDVLASMQVVAERLERNEMVTVATNSFAFFSSSGQTGDSIVDYNVEISGVSDSLDGNFWYKSNNNKKIKVVLQTDSSQEIHEFIDDTVFSGAEIRVITQVDSVDPVAAIKVGQRINTKRRVFTKVVEEMMFQEARQPHRVHPVIIDSLLKEEFKSHGIHLVFEFGVFDEGVKDFRVIKTSNPEKLKSSPLQASLFPNDILSTNLLLMVNFPNENRYLIGKVWSSLLISFIFILMIIGIFTYVVYKIIHQKKVADLKNDFINNMTHEFKTPIATVSLATEALQEEAVQSSPKTMNRYIEVIQQESKRLGTQVEKVLQLATMERDNLTFNKVKTSVNLLVESGVERARFQVEENQGSLSVNFLEEDATIYVDETHFSNAIFNLLDNAIKYSGNSPDITLTVGRTERDVTISVEDKGIGLTKEQQHQVFDKFYRVPTGNLHDVKGFGLGLNYVQYVVEAHHGKIHLQSEINRGSTFSILIPLSV